MDGNDGAWRKRDIQLGTSSGDALAGLSEEPSGFDGPASDPAQPSETQGEEARSEGAQSEDAGKLTGISLERGVQVISDQVSRLPNRPGVYRMLNGKGDPVYVGKAKNLKKRVANYTQLPRLPNRLRRMVAETVDMEIVVTHTEVEALLLESNLIKRFMPRYNVLLRDDKSFPYILIRTGHESPQITKHRGAQKEKGEYFGPFASAGAVNRTLTALEKAFLLRSCTDHVYENRTRPCLLYQIKRCSAPCAGKISEANYSDLVDDAKAFLFGRSNAVQTQMATDMQAAAENLDFETAARYRDRIRALTAIQAKQDVNVEGVLEEADVLALAQEGGQTCVQVFFFRAGRNYGNRSYFPSHDRKLEIGEVLTQFVAQFYDDKPAPGQLLLSHDPDERELLAEALSLRAGRKVEVLIPQRGAKKKVIDTAVRNAQEALARRQAESRTQRNLLDGLAQALQLDGPPERIEVYDNSHLQGTNAYGCMIVAGSEGMRKSAYRKWTIKQAGAGDDYDMMREVFERRFKRAIREREACEAAGESDPNWPDLVLIDGGKGQLSVVKEVLDELGVTDVPLCAIAKGPDRDAGRETLFQPGRAPFKMEANDPVLYFLQRLRDEAHRFAIGTHRAKRSKQLGKSQLDQIEGVGATRKKALLLHFGSAGAVARAGLADLQNVNGISGAVAEKIYNHFHSS